MRDKSLAKRADAAVTRAIGILGNLQIAGAIIIVAAIIVGYLLS